MSKLSNATISDMSSSDHFVIVRGGSILRASPIDAGIPSSSSTVTSTSTTDSVTIVRDGETYLIRLSNVYNRLANYRETASATDTLQANDAGGVVVYTSASAVTTTVNSGMFVEGDVINIVQAGAGAVTLSEGSGVTIDGGPTSKGLDFSMTLFGTPTSETFRVAGGDL